MSVWLVAIEKERSLPWASFYLGEAKTEKIMMGMGSPLCVSGPVRNLHRMDHYPITVGQAVSLLTLLESEDALWEDHEAVEAMKFVGAMFATTEDKYVLYVEVS